MLWKVASTPPLHSLQRRRRRQIQLQLGARHGGASDDLVTAARTRDEVKVRGLLGPDPKDDKAIRIQNRCLEWRRDGNSLECLDKMLEMSCRVVSACSLSGWTAVRLWVPGSHLV